MFSTFNITISDRRKKIVHHVVFFKIDIVGHTSEYEIEVYKLYVRLVQYLTLSLQWFFPRC